MESMTETAAYSHIEGKNKLDTRVIELAYAIKKLRKYRGDFLSYEINGDVVNFDLEDYRCGDRDVDTYNFPISYLWSDDFEQLALAAIADRLEKQKIATEKAIKEATRERAERAATRETAEYKKYLDLKAKFEKI